MKSPRMTMRATTPGLILPLKRTHSLTVLFATLCDAPS
jgi:hypothetical protein